MAGEIITASTLEEGREQLRNIYKAKAKNFHAITKEEYFKYELSEREDSDNHLNLERLGKESDVVDLAYYKFLPHHKTAYRINLIHVDGVSRLEDYFIIEPIADA